MKQKALNFFFYGVNKGAPPPTPPPISDDFDETAKEDDQLASPTYLLNQFLTRQVWFPPLSGHTPSSTQL